MSHELRLLMRDLLAAAKGYADTAVRPFTIGGKLDRGTKAAVGRTPIEGGGTGHGQGAEPPLGNPAADGQVLASTAAGVRSWVANGVLTVEEVDGAPSVSATTLRLPAGTLAIAGGVATYTPPAAPPRGYYAPLTNCDPDFPDLVYVNGQVAMVWIAL